MQPFVRVSVCVREIVVSSLCSAGGDSVPAASSAGAGSCAGAGVWQTNGVYFLNGVALEDPLVEEIPVEEPETPADGSAFNLCSRNGGTNYLAGAHYLWASFFRAGLVSMLLPICSGQMQLAEAGPWDAWSFVSSPPPEAESCPSWCVEGGQD